MEITTENIHKYIKSIFELDSKVKCDTIFSVAARITNDHIRNQRFDHMDMLYSQLLNELSQGIFKHIINKIDVEYTNVFSSIKDLEMASFEFIRDNKTLFNKKIILSSLVATSIQDTLEFEWQPTEANTSGSPVYKIGKFNGNDVFVDAYKRYNDNTLMLYDNIRYNIELKEIKSIADYSGNNISIEVNIGYEFDGIEHYAVLCSDGYVSKSDILNKMKKEEL